MKFKQLTFAVVLTYFWVMMILFGSIVLETFMVFPNIFRDPPQSLELAMDFLSTRGPGDFFPPLGFLSWLTGVGAIVLGWQVKSARYWIIASVLMIFLEGIVSILFFWPRNTIMFIEGTSVHSSEYLKQVASEFHALHWLRLALNGASAVFIFIGFLKIYKDRLLSREQVLLKPTSNVRVHS
jgi:hypothetical protein